MDSIKGFPAIPSSDLCYELKSSPLYMDACTTDQLLTPM